MIKIKSKLFVIDAGSVVIVKYTDFYTKKHKGKLKSKLYSRRKYSICYYC